MKSILLAYSGGLDTSVAVHWLRNTYDSDVHCLIVDVGQEEDLDVIKARAIANGAKSVIIKDVRQEFANDFIFEMLQGHPSYEMHYLLGSAIARPLISKHLYLEAKKLGVEAVAHGATGKGNDQFRFELALASLGSTFPVIAPWREWGFGSRADLVEYANLHGVTLEEGTRKSKPLSVDRNLVHTSYEGDLLEDPTILPPTQAFDRVCNIEQASEEGALLTISFEEGKPKAINGHKVNASKIMHIVNEVGSRNAIGRVDHVESRFIGMKSRNVYETPGLTILYAAHRAAEAMCLDKEVLFLKEELMPKYARQIYDGLWFAPERFMLQAAINFHSKFVNADISVLLKKGNVTVQRRFCKSSLYDIQLSSIEEDRDFDHKNASGYINLSAIRLASRPNIPDELEHILAGV